ncbi:hypothetical protein [Taibaiella soli]|nr:hypothetical protein [Taibaiella soli]
MSVDFLDEETSQIQTDSQLKAGALSVVPSSVDVSGIELRMLPPFIRDNRTLRIWPFPGYAKLYCLTIVISDVANQLTGLMDLNAFPRIGKNEFLPVNKSIFYWEDKDGASQAPNQLHTMCSVIKSKESLRETGDIMTHVKDDAEYKSLVDKLSSVVADTASFAAVTNISMQIANIVGQYLGKVDDKPIGTVVNSYTRLHGDWDKLGITPIAAATKNVDFNFELVIRDRNREQPAATSGTTTSRLVLPLRDHALQFSGMLPM